MPDHDPTRADGAAALMRKAEARTGLHGLRRCSLSSGKSWACSPGVAPCGRRRSAWPSSPNKAS
jgi:hypothetical protein